MQAGSRSFWTRVMYLPDVNLWLALAFESHVNHARAKSWFGAALNDAFLAAFAKTAGFELLTFDKGFAQYVDVKCTILS